MLLTPTIISNRSNRPLVRWQPASNTSNSADKEAPSELEANTLVRLADTWTFTAGKEGKLTQLCICRCMFFYVPYQLTSAATEMETVGPLNSKDISCWRISLGLFASKHNLGPHLKWLRLKCWAKIRGCTAASLTLH